MGHTHSERKTIPFSQAQQEYREWAQMEELRRLITELEQQVIREKRKQERMERRRIRNYNTPSAFISRHHDILMRRHGYKVEYTFSDEVEYIYEHSISYIYSKISKEYPEIKIYTQDNEIIHILK